MPKKYSELEELNQIRDRLIIQNKDLEQKLKSFDDTRLSLSIGMQAERMELLSRVAKLELRALAIGFDLTKPPRLPQ